jgi:pimeloyl-ACP methyl ester carboxylesterase
VRVVALHGLPTSPRLFERLVLPSGWLLEAPPIPGLGPEGTPENWTLAATAATLAPVATQADVLVGHDMGGVLAAMLAQPDQLVVLSGTALGLYWKMIRVTAWPGLHRIFYKRHGGRYFLRRGSLPAHRDGLLAAFGDHGMDWPSRMRRIAAGMRPPPGLARSLGKSRVRLAWGRHDPWYPAPVVHSVRRSAGARLTWLDAGHFAPWEDPEGFRDVLLSP